MDRLCAFEITHKPQYVRHYSVHVYVFGAGCWARYLVLYLQVAV